MVDSAYTYDNLGRSKKTTTSDGDEYTYRYTGDGQLYEMKDKNGGSPIQYRYNYDSLGRLIGTSQTGGAGELRATYRYDTNNRLTRMNYSIPGIIDSGEESFYYNGDGRWEVEDRANVSEGTLKGMALFSKRSRRAVEKYCKVPIQKSTLLGGPKKEKRSWHCGRLYMYEQLRVTDLLAHLAGNFYRKLSQFFALILCILANGGKACIFRHFHHLLGGRALWICQRFSA